MTSEGQSCRSWEQRTQANTLANHETCALVGGPEPLPKNGKGRVIRAKRVATGTALAPLERREKEGDPSWPRSLALQSVRHFVRSRGQRMVAGVTES